MRTVAVLFVLTCVSGHVFADTGIRPQCKEETLSTLSFATDEFKYITGWIGDSKVDQAGYEARHGDLDGLVMSVYRVSRKMGFGTKSNTAREHGEIHDAMTVGKQLLHELKAAAAYRRAQLLEADAVRRAALRISDKLQATEKACPEFDATPHQKNVSKAVKALNHLVEVREDQVAQLLITAFWARHYQAFLDSASSSIGSE
jgi:hypothetical protein